MQDLKSLIRTIPDYPKPGIMFRDVTTLLGDAQGFKAAIEQMAAPFAAADVQAVAGIEARGFILGGAIADRLGCGFVPLRKKGKLPWKTIGQEYTLEYGVDIIEMHEDAIDKGERILIVDDLIATGGTAEAAAKLVQRSGGEIVGAAFIIDLPELGGMKKLVRPRRQEPRADGLRGALSGMALTADQHAMPSAASPPGGPIRCRRRLSRLRNAGPDHRRSLGATLRGVVRAGLRACGLDETLHIPLGAPVQAWIRH